jgi:hypothetical protein
MTEQEARKQAEELEADFDHNGNTFMGGLGQSVRLQDLSREQRIDLLTRLLMSQKEKLMQSNELTKQDLAALENNIKELAPKLIPILEQYEITVVCATLQMLLADGLTTMHGHWAGMRLLESITQIFQEANNNTKAKGEGAN